MYFVFKASREPSDSILTASFSLTFLLPSSSTTEFLKSNIFYEFFQCHFTKLVKIINIKKYLKLTIE